MLGQSQDIILHGTQGGTGPANSVNVMSLRERRGDLVAPYYVWSHFYYPLLIVNTIQEKIFARKMHVMLIPSCSRSHIWFN